MYKKNMDKNMKKNAMRSPDVMAKIRTISTAISEGASSFLWAEYRIMAGFMVVFGLIIFVVLGSLSGDGDHWMPALFSTISFEVGAATSIISGFIGMKIAVAANSRTAIRASISIGDGFVTAFKAGAVMGFALVSAALINLFILICLYKLHFHNDAVGLYEAISAYGLGGSSIALFGRVGGGIYTKAADVGADLVGKVEKNIPEDDPRNPAVIADNVGDNVGDIAGMGADLFGSFAEATCAALVVSSKAPELGVSWSAMMFPLLITATGIIVCLLTSFVATHILVVSDISEIEPSLKRQLLISTILMTPVIYALTAVFLPHEFTLEFNGDIKTPKSWHIFFCVACGLWSGLIIGYVTEYFTSNAYGPVKDVAYSSRTGAATLIIYGLALGYKSVIIPVICLCVTIYVSFSLASVYGIAVAALGILSTLAIGLTIDAYGPISDNAGGIAEMAGMGPEVRKRTDALDAAGNTTAAVGKGFAIGSAALVSLALFGAYTTSAGLMTVNILDPYPFAGLLYGSMLPYWFSAMTMKSVGKAALAMVEEVREQFRTIPGLMEGTGVPNYRRCVEISTQASLREMLPPGALVMLTPLFVGFLFGTEALAGVLVGGLVSGVQVAISMSNSGGAWDNAKKYIESGILSGKGSDAHHAAVVGDTVGDPFKDTSGPALNILMKLMAIISLVFAGALKHNGNLLSRAFSKHHKHADD
jgi:H(+)-translocating pyrophosphatase